VTGPLSRLEDVVPTEVWRYEAHDFTPWLLTNHDVLAKVLGIDLELTANEHPVGSFALDLIGRDLTNDCVLIVENQLTVTDHSHLGQIMTYAAGTDAATVVWLATGFREEHRAALDWLNILAQGNARFFGVEIGAVRIEESPVAPLFKVIVQPNDWQAQRAKDVEVSRELTGRPALYQQFWTRFLERVHVEHPGWTNSRKPGGDNWFDMPCPFRGGPRFSNSFRAGGKLGFALYIDYYEPSSAERLYNFLLARRSDIERVYGGLLEWDEREGRRARLILDTTAGDVTRVDEYDCYIDWFFDAGIRLREALKGAAVEWASDG
jgi:Domain of unknown function (DUF4268)